MYAELPSAQHPFDLYHSIRFEAVIDGISVFAASVDPTAVAARRSGGAAPDEAV